MKRLLFVVTLILLTTQGQPAANPVPWGGISLNGSPDATVHYVYDLIPGVLDVYVVHEIYSPDGRMGASFSAPPPPCFAATYVGETVPFLIIAGNTQDGMEIGYGGCMTGPVLLATIHYFVTGLTTQCCWYWTSPHPDTGKIQAVHCDGTLHEEYGGPVIINPDLQSYCGTPVEETSWGGIKALYQQ